MSYGPQNRLILIHLIIFYEIIKKFTGMYWNPLEILEELEEYLYCTIAFIIPEMIQFVQENLIHRANLCIQIEDLYFEHMF